MKSQDSPLAKVLWHVLVPCQTELDLPFFAGTLCATVLPRRARVCWQDYASVAGGHLREVCFELGAWVHHDDLGHGEDARPTVHEGFPDVLRRFGAVPDQGVD